MQGGNIKTITFEGHARRVWQHQDFLKIIKLKCRPLPDKEIAKIMDTTILSIKSILVQLRRNPQYAGTIPYIKYTHETIKNTDKKIGIIDIEFWAQDYNANRGFIVSYCIKEYKKSKYYKSLIDPTEIRRGEYDKNIVQKLIKDILKFDILVGYYSSGCDIPWIRTRALKHGLDFPFYDTIKQLDLYYIVKFKLRLQRRSLEQACKLCNIKGKTHIDYDNWEKFVMTGDRKAGKEILAHNISDVKITEKLFTKLKPYCSGILKTI